ESDWCITEPNGAAAIFRSNARSATMYKYYTGYPKDLGPSRIIHFTSECEFVKLLHEGNPMVVAFSIR
ncbi:unnamed protein product, partial [Linum tenue]